MSGHAGRRSPTSPPELAAVFAGGMAGALARVGLAQALPPQPGSWPWATFAANLAGALLLGWVLAGLAPTARATLRRSLVGAGVCGALTTFSTLQLELLHMLDAGRLGLALGYAAASLAAGLAVVALGERLATRRGDEGAA